MSKEGASTARWALSIALDTITLRNKPLKEYYNSVKNRKGSGNYAHVAMMRKLIRMTFTMLNERKEKRYENTVLTEGKLSGPDDDGLQTLRSMETAAWLIGN